MPSPSILRHSFGKADVVSHYKVKDDPYPRLRGPESITGSGSYSDLQSKQVPTLSGCVHHSFHIPAVEL